MGEKTVREWDQIKTLYEKRDSKRKPWKVISRKEKKTKREREKERGGVERVKELEPRSVRV